MDPSLKQQLLALMAPVLTELAVDVYDIERHGNTVRITLDRDDEAIGIDDCSSVSRYLSHAMEADLEEGEEGLIPGPYRLEVTTPGLDRALRCLEEFQRFVGRLCRIKLVEPLDGNYVLVGRITGVAGQQITLTLPDDTAHALDYDSVAKARLEIEF